MLQILQNHRFMRNFCNVCNVSISKIRVNRIIETLWEMW